MSKTFVACRPGFLQAAMAAFNGFEIEVDPSLEQDYEFRQRDLGLADLLEAELESEEEAAAKKADPKNALNLVVPLDPTGELEDANWLPYLIVRVDKNSKKDDVEKVINSTRVVMGLDEEVNERATLVLLRNELTKAGITVHSLSVANGLTWMKR